MFDKEETLKICRNIVQNAKCNEDNFERICSYYYFLCSSFEALERYENEYGKAEFDSPEAKTLWEKITNTKNNIYKDIAIIAIFSAL